MNTTGMDLVDDMRAAIQNASTKPLTDLCGLVYDDPTKIATCESNNANSFILVSKKAKVELNSKETLNNIPVLGAFCTGTYSYIWNSGYFFADNSDGYPKISGATKASFKYKVGASNKTVSDFKLLKVRDDNHVVCIAASKNGLNTNIFDLRGNLDNPSEEPVDLLATNEASLTLYDLSAMTPASSKETRGLFYYVSFVLGTAQGGINVASTGNFCSAPNDYDGEALDYCAINKFNFAVRATGE